MSGFTSTDRDVVSTLAGFDLFQFPEGSSALPTDVAAAILEAKGLAGREPSAEQLQKMRAAYVVLTEGARQKWVMPVVARLAGGVVLGGEGQTHRSAPTDSAISPRFRRKVEIDEATLTKMAEFPEKVREAHAAAKEPNPIFFRPNFLRWWYVLTAQDAPALGAQALVRGGELLFGRFQEVETYSAAELAQMNAPAEVKKFMGRAKVMAALQKMADKATVTVKVEAPTAEDFWRPVWGRVLEYTGMTTIAHFISTVNADAPDLAEKFLQELAQKDFDLSETVRAEMESVGANLVFAPNSAQIEGEHKVRPYEALKFHLLAGHYSQANAELDSLYKHALSLSTLEEQTVAVAELRKVFKEIEAEVKAVRVETPPATSAIAAEPLQMSPEAAAALLTVKEALIAGMQKCYEQTWVAIDKKIRKGEPVSQTFLIIMWSTATGLKILGDPLGEQILKERKDEFKKCGLNQNVSLKTGFKIIEGSYRDNAKSVTKNVEQAKQGQWTEVIKRLYLDSREIYTEGFNFAFLAQVIKEQLEAAGIDLEAEHVPVQGQSIFTNPASPLAYKQAMAKAIEAAAFSANNGMDESRFGTAAIKFEALFYLEALCKKLALPFDRRPLARVEEIVKQAVHKIHFSQVTSEQFPELFVLMEQEKWQQALAQIGSQEPKTQADLLSILDNKMSGVFPSDEVIVTSIEQLQAGYHEANQTKPDKNVAWVDAYIEAVMRDGRYSGPMDPTDEFQSLFAEPVLANFGQKLIMMKGGGSSARVVYDQLKGGLISIALQQIFAYNLDLQEQMFFAGLLAKMVFERAPVGESLAFAPTEIYVNPCSPLAIRAKLFELAKKLAEELNHPTVPPTTRLLGLARLEVIYRLIGEARLAARIHAEISPLPGYDAAKKNTKDRGGFFNFQSVLFLIKEGFKSGHLETFEEYVIKEPRFTLDNKGFILQMAAEEQEAVGGLIAAQKIKKAIQKLQKEYRKLLAALTRNADRADWADAYIEELLRSGTYTGLTDKSDWMQNAFSQSDKKEFDLILQAQGHVAYTDFYEQIKSPAGLKEALKDLHVTDSVDNTIFKAVALAKMVFERTPGTSVMGAVSPLHHAPTQPDLLTLQRPALLQIAQQLGQKLHEYYANILGPGHDNFTISYGLAYLAHFYEKMGRPHECNEIDNVYSEFLKLHHTHPDIKKAALEFRAGGLNYQPADDDEITQIKTALGAGDFAEALSLAERTHNLADQAYALVLVYREIENRAGANEVDDLPHLLALAEVTLISDQFIDGVGKFYGEIDQILTDASHPLWGNKLLFEAHRIYEELRDQGTINAGLILMQVQNITGADLRKLWTLLSSPNPTPDQVDDIYEIVIGKTFKACPFIKEALAGRWTEAFKGFETLTDPLNKAVLLIVLGKWLGDKMATASVGQAQRPAPTNTYVNPASPLQIREKIIGILKNLESRLQQWPTPMTDDQVVLNVKKWASLAACYKQLGEVQKADELYKHALSLRPGYRLILQDYYNEVFTLGWWQRNGEDDEDGDTLITKLVSDFKNGDSNSLDQFFSGALPTDIIHYMRVVVTELHGDGRLMSREEFLQQTEAAYQAAQNRMQHQFRDVGNFEYTAVDWSLKIAQSLRDGTPIDYSQLIPIFPAHKDTQKIEQLAEVFRHLDLELLKRVVPGIVPIINAAQDGDWKTALGLLHHAISTDLYVATAVLHKMFLEKTSDVGAGPRARPVIGQPRGVALTETTYANPTSPLQIREKIMQAAEPFAASLSSKSPLEQVSALMQLSEICRRLGDPKAKTVWDTAELVVSTANLDPLVLDTVRKMAKQPDSLKRLDQIHKTDLYARFERLCAGDSSGFDEIFGTPGHESNSLLVLLMAVKELQDENKLMIRNGFLARTKKGFDVLVSKQGEAVTDLFGFDNTLKSWAHEACKDLREGKPVDWGRFKVLEYSHPDANKIHEFDLFLRSLAPTLIKDYPKAAEILALARQGNWEQALQALGRIERKEENEYFIALLVLHKLFFDKTAAAPTLKSKILAKLAKIEVLDPIHSTYVHSDDRIRVMFECLIGCAYRICGEEEKAVEHFAKAKQKSSAGYAHITNGGPAHPRDQTIMMVSTDVTTECLDIIEFFEKEWDGDADSAIQKVFTLSQFDAMQPTFDVVAGSDFDAGLFHADSLQEPIHKMGLFFAAVVKEVGKNLPLSLTLPHEGGGNLVPSPSGRGQGEGGLWPPEVIPTPPTFGTLEIYNALEKIDLSTIREEHHAFIPAEKRVALFDRMKKLVDEAAHLLTSSERIALRFFGPPGTAKTTIPELIAHKLGLPLMRFSFGSKTDPLDLEGVWQQEEIDGEIVPVFLESPIVTAMREGYLLVLDEPDIARVGVLAALNNVIAPGEFAWVRQKNGELVKIKVHERFRVVLTENGQQTLGRKEHGDDLLGRVVSFHVETWTEAEICYVITELYEKKDGRQRFPHLFSELLAKVHATISKLAEGFVDPINNKRVESLGAGITQKVEFTPRSVLRLCDKIIRNGRLTPENLSRLLRSEYILPLADVTDRELVWGQIQATLQPFAKAMKWPNDAIGPQAIKTPTKESISAKYLNNRPFPADGDFSWTPQALRLVDEILWNWSMGVDVMLLGTAGFGKTEIARQLAKLLGKELYSKVLNSETETTDLVGGLGKINGKVGFVPDMLTLGAERGGINHLDEVLMADGPKIEGTLNPAMDDAKAVIIPAPFKVVSRKRDGDIFHNPYLFTSNYPWVAEDRNEQSGALMSRVATICLEGEFGMETKDRVQIMAGWAAQGVEIPASTRPGPFPAHRDFMVGAIRNHFVNVGQGSDEVVELKVHPEMQEKFKIPAQLFWDKKNQIILEKNAEGTNEPVGEVTLQSLKAMAGFLTRKIQTDMSLLSARVFDVKYDLTAGHKALLDEKNPTLILGALDLVGLPIKAALGVGNHEYAHGVIDGAHDFYDAFETARALANSVGDPRMNNWASSLRGDIAENITALNQLYWPREADKTHVDAFLKYLPHEQFNLAIIHYALHHEIMPWITDERVVDALKEALPILEPAFTLFPQTTLREDVDAANVEFYAILDQAWPIYKKLLSEAEQDLAERIAKGEKPDDLAKIQELLQQLFGQGQNPGVGAHRVRPSGETASAAGDEGQTQSAPTNADAPQTPGEPAAAAQSDQSDSVGRSAPDPLGTRGADSSDKSDASEPKAAAPDLAQLIKQVLEQRAEQLNKLFAPLDPEQLKALEERVAQAKAKAQTEPVPEPQPQEATPEPKNLDPNQVREIQEAQFQALNRSIENDLYRRMVPPSVFAAEKRMKRVLPPTEPQLDGPFMTGPRLHRNRAAHDIIAQTGRVSLKKVTPVDHSAAFLLLSDVTGSLVQAKAVDNALRCSAATIHLCEKFKMDYGEVFFGSEVRIQKPLGGPLGSYAKKNELLNAKKAAFDDRSINCGTDIRAAIVKGIELVKAKKAKIKFMVLMTDGEETQIFGQKTLKELDAECESLGIHLVVLAMGEAKDHVPQNFKHYRLLKDNGSDAPEKLVDLLEECQNSRFKPAAPEPSRYSGGARARHFVGVGGGNVVGANLRVRPEMDVPGEGQTHRSAPTTKPKAMLSANTRLATPKFLTPGVMTYMHRQAMPRGLLTGPGHMMKVLR